ncbi:MAG: PEP-CTERM sorting domain-containing protein [Pseudomonadota bacterium]
MAVLPQSMTATLVCTLLTQGALASITEVDYFSLAGTELIDFEGLIGGGAPGTNYDDLIDLDGATFGERFNGQTLGFNGFSDVLSGTPMGGSLSLVAGDSNQNLNIFERSGSNVLTGLGPLGFPDFDAIGEGAVSVLFDNDQSEFGFLSVGGNLGGATFEFWARDGSLIDTLTPMGLDTDFFGFTTADGLATIAGISIWNLDPAGIGFDDIVFDVPGIQVPEPSSLLLVAVGVLGAAYARRGRLAA